MLGCIPVFGVRKCGRSPLLWDKEVLYTQLSVLVHSLCKNYFLKGEWTGSPTYDHVLGMQEGLFIEAFIRVLQRNRANKRDL